MSSCPKRNPWSQLLWEYQSSTVKNVVAIQWNITSFSGYITGILFHLNIKLEGSSIASYCGIGCFLHDRGIHKHNKNILCLLPGIFMPWYIFTTWYFLLYKYLSEMTFISLFKFCREIIPHYLKFFSRLWYMHKGHPSKSRT